MADFINGDKVTTIFISNVAKFAEAQKAQLDYTNENLYYQSAWDWYKNYLTEKHSEDDPAGKYDEYIETINNIMFEIMGRLVLDDNGKAWLPQTTELEDDQGNQYGAFFKEGLQEDGILGFEIYQPVPTTQGNPFFDFDSQTEEAVLKCPDEVVEILEENGYTIDVDTTQFKITTLFPVSAMVE